MKFVVNHKFYELEDKYAIISKYFKALLETQVPVDKDSEGNIILDVDNYGFEQYLLYLQGKDFEPVVDVFEYFLTFNEFHYPLDFWKIKLYDSWVRDNCYRLGLFKDPYYGLIKLEVKEKRVTKIAKKIGQLPEGHYIAGGAALYMAGLSDRHSDIDIFTTNIESSNKWLTEHVDLPWYSSNSVNLDNRVQLILRCYTCPSEIVHGFDVASCAIIYDGKDIWCTVRAYYSLIHELNWLEPDRSSPTYIHRLAKYHLRGYKVQMPSFDDLEFQEHVYPELERKALDYWYGQVDEDVLYQGELRYFTKDMEIYVDNFIQESSKWIDIDTSGLKDTNLSNLFCRSRLAWYLEERGEQEYKLYRFLDDLYSYISNFTERVELGIIEAKELYRLYNQHDQFIQKYAIAQGNSPLNCIMSQYTFMRYRLELPSDPISLLVLLVKYGINPAYIAKVPTADYEDKKLKPMYKVTQLKWKVSDPMSQLTSSFHPESIEDLRAEYLKSPFFR